MDDDAVVLPRLGADRLGLRIKRVLDVVGAAALLVVAMPIFLAAALAVRLTSAGPIFHTQRQIGLGRRPFTLWKFRTMVPGADRQEATLRQTYRADGPFFKVKNDPRVTPTGRVLRRYSIDELPQLYNVLRGDMSLVGPRPLFDFEVEGFTDPRHFERFTMRPGLTCIWQVSGRSTTTDAARMQHDLEYVQHWSLILDLKLLLKTIPAVLRGHGAE